MLVVILVQRDDGTTKVVAAGLTDSMLGCSDEE